ncbi:hypothetical protein ACN27J_01490 [Solwaraspora sp. WMMB762]|uniref:hypothetical protein n=1 Tax=Solwaraspora sp. WMMB762 TaxID=3404120 RepID=UPI003B92D66C
MNLELFLSLFILSPLVLGIWLSVQRTRRLWRSTRATAALVTSVNERGWSYQQHDRELLSRFGSFPISAPTTCDAITGRHRGRPFWCFELREVNDWGNVQACLRVFAVAVRQSGPTVQVTKTGQESNRYDLTDTTEFATGNSHIDAWFRVTTDDVAFARALLNPQIGRWLVEHPDRSVRLTGDALVTWQERRLTAPSIEPALDYLCDLADHLPD